MLLPNVAGICTEIKIQILADLKNSALRMVSVDPCMICLPRSLMGEWADWDTLGPQQNEVHPSFSPISTPTHGTKQLSLFVA